MSDTVIVRVPQEWEREFNQFWTLIRSGESLARDEDLGKPDVIDRADAGALVEWIIKLTPAATAILTAMLGFVVARRGEVVIMREKEKTNVTFKHVRAHDIQKILDTLFHGEVKRQ